MKKILVTGASGMVGRNLCEHQFSKNYIVLRPDSKELNLLDKENTFDYLSVNQPEAVVHCAGLVGGIQANMANPVGFLTENVQMGLNLVNSAYELGIKKLINLGSSCMYPREAKNPLCESMILQGGLEPTNEGYALAKIVVAKLCEYVSSSNEGLQYKTVIPCNLYGSYDKFDAHNSHMVPAAITKIHDAKKSNASSVVIWGNGEARREFMHVEDLVDFIYYALKKFDDLPQNINVGLGKDYSINDYYRTIASVVGFDGVFTHDTSKPVGMKQKLISDSKLKKFGWSHNISLEEGLKKTYQYYLEEIKNDK